MEEMFISDSSDGWNQRFYKWKPQFYKSTVQTISRGGLDCNKQVGALCAHFFYMGSLVKTQMENGLCKIFNFWGQTIDVSDQAILP